MAGEETASFAHTVLVDFRARLRRSQDPDRIFRVTCELARQLGLVGAPGAGLGTLGGRGHHPGHRDHVAGRHSRGCCGPARHGWPPRSARCCSAMTTTPRPASRPVTGPIARLGGAGGRPGPRRLPGALRPAGQRLDPRVAEAAALLATVTGQDIEETADGRFAIFEGTASDRVISTVDPQARHGHKTAAHGFDGYKAHVAIDPDARSSPRPRSARPPAATPRSRRRC